MNQEDIDNKLNSITQKISTKKKIEAVESMPKSLLKTCRMLNGQDPQTGKKKKQNYSYYYNNSQRERDQKNTAEALEQLSTKQRIAVFELFTGDLAPLIEDSWQWLQHQHFTVGWGIKAFRSPSNVERVRFSRIDWLSRIFRLCGDYNLTPENLLEFAPLLGYSNHYLTEIFASQIDKKSNFGKTAFKHCIRVLMEDNTAEEMGQYIISTLLKANQKEGWEAVEKLLLAAQRQEGLRQSIVEAVVLAHPQAFIRMIKLILQENLLRFSSIARGIDVWFAQEWDARSVKAFRVILEKCLSNLENETLAQKATGSDDPETVYFGLWALAFYDIEKALPVAQNLITDKRDTHRFIAAYFLQQSSCAESRQIAEHGLQDPHPTVLAHSLWAIPDDEDIDLSDILITQLERHTQKTVAAPPMVWPWTETKFNTHQIANSLTKNRGEKSITDIAKYKDRMDPYGRALFVEQVAKECKGNQSSPLYNLLLEMAKDRSSDVVDTVFKYLKRIKINEEASLTIESLLTRKSANFRRSSLRLILGQNDTACLKSIDRLTASKNAAQRVAGLELGSEMVSKDRSKAKVIKAIETFSDSHKNLTKDEQNLLDLVLAQDREQHTFTNALGLADPNLLPIAEPPKSTKVSRKSKAAESIILSLHTWIEQHAEIEVDVYSYYSEDPEKEIYGTILYDISYDQKKDFKENLKRMPLGKELIEWFTDALTNYKDKDGLQVLRAHLHAKELAAQTESYWSDNQKLPKLNDIKLTYIDLLDDLLSWLNSSTKYTTSQLDVLINYAAAEAAEYAKDHLSPKGYKKKKSLTIDDSETYTWLYQIYGSELTDDQFKKLFNLERWLWRPTIIVDANVTQVAKVARVDYYRFSVILRAHKLGIIDDNEILFSLCGSLTDKLTADNSFETYQLITARKPLDDFKNEPSYNHLVSLAQRVKDRVLEIEIERGDLKQITSPLASAITYVNGAQNFMDFVVALGKNNLVRQHQWGEDSYAKNSIFSSLIRVSEPGNQDNSELFNTLAEKSGLSKERFIEIAMFAPQWAALIESYIHYKGLEDAVWWIHAHTKDEQWEVSQEVREIWNAKVAEKTPLSSSDLVDGAVDVVWFQKVYQQLKKAKWTVVLSAAKFASSSGGHKRAELFARAMLKQATKTEITSRIKNKRHQDSVRALGLLPLANGKAREKDLLSRYELFKEFVRQSKQFGSQRQASEKRCAQIGSENLARTAGYADPIRLEWAMEANAVKDLQSGSVSMHEGDVTITLRIDEFGEPQIEVQRDDKPLKAVPAKLKKIPAVKKFTARKTQIKKQISRMRKSLEEMMCLRDALTGAELQTMIGHPLLNRLISQLVLTCEGAMGYAAKEGKALTCYQGKLEPVGAEDPVRIAHPHDFFESSDWAKWQHHCFETKKTQPFKQVFRELYPISEAERSDVNHRSARYAGHQVNPRQALALLGGRGWLTVPEEGVRKVFHQDEICAWIDFEEYFYTPAELEGLTLASVYFFKKDGTKIIPLHEVPPHVFSECMRDVDLVVSVAHMGGVDPEASQSTVEMRTALAEETAELLGLNNVSFEKNHVMIEGALAKYSIHLGSSLVHTLPGQALFIVAIQSQHRGRIFLPFADSDPKTAELLSKMILLARDKQIKDPKILAQLK